MIEATENLAKMPVDDFTEGTGRSRSRGMAAAEDDWAKFMNDLHSRPEQTARARLRQFVDRPRNWWRFRRN